MRSILYICCFSLISTLSLAQSKSLKFETERIDLGTLKSNDSTVTVTFTYRNVNVEKAPVGIVEIQPLCPCITPEYSDEAVKHWETGEIKVTYDPSKVNAGEFENSMYVITDAFENNYQLFLTGTVIDDSGESNNWLTVDDLKKTEGVAAAYKMELGFDVTFVDSLDKKLRKFVKQVGVMLNKQDSVEIVIEASTSQVSSKKYEQKQELAEIRMTDALKVLIAMMEGSGIDDSKVSFITSAFVDGPEAEDDDKEKEQHQDYEYIHFKLREIKAD